MSASSWDDPRQGGKDQILASMKMPALLLIDSQENFVNYYGEKQISEMKLLVDAFRAACLPIVFKLWPQPHNWGGESWNVTCAPKTPLSDVAPSTESEANRTVKYTKYDHVPTPGPEPRTGSSPPPLLLSRSLVLPSSPTAGSSTTTHIWTSCSRRGVSTLSSSPAASPSIASSPQRTPRSCGSIR